MEACIINENHRPAEMKKEDRDNIQIPGFMESDKELQFLHFGVDKPIIS